MRQAAPPAAMPAAPPPVPQGAADATTLRLAIDGSRFRTHRHGPGALPLQPCHRRPAGLSVAKPVASGAFPSTQAEETNTMRLAFPFLALIVLVLAGCGGTGQSSHAQGQPGNHQHLPAHLAPGYSQR